MDSNNPYGNNYYTDQRPGPTNQAPQYVADARGHWHQSSASNHNQFGRAAAGFIARIGDVVAANLWICYS